MPIHIFNTFNDPSAAPAPLRRSGSMIRTKSSGLIRTVAASTASSKTVARTSSSTIPWPWMTEKPRDLRSGNNDVRRARSNID